MKLGTERTAIQKPLIRYATEVGWAYLSPDEALRLRGGEEGRLLREVFLTQVQRLNPGVVDHVRAEELAGRLTRVLPRIEGNLEAWEYLRGLKTVFVAEEKREGLPQAGAIAQQMQATFQRYPHWQTSAHQELLQ